MFFLETTEDKTKTKPTQIRECSIVIKKIPLNAKTFEGIKIMNAATIMGKEVESKITLKKKQTAAVVIPEKATNVKAKKDKTIRSKASSVVIEKNKIESVHVLRNRVVKTDLKTKTPVIPAKTSTQKVSRTHFQDVNLAEIPQAASELNPTKKSARLINRSKLVFAEIKTDAVKHQAKKVATVSPIQIKVNNTKKNEPIASTSKLQNEEIKELDKNDDKSSEKCNNKGASKVKESTIKDRSKRLIEKNISKTKEVEVFSSASEPENNFELPKPIVKSKIKIPFTKKANNTIVNNTSSNNKQLSSVITSPTYRSKLEETNDDDMDDIYDFPMSQSMVENSKVTTVNKVGLKKKRIRQTGKAGSKLELLMKKSTMNVIGNSCHVQNNPDLYKMKQMEMNKMIIAQKTRTNSPKLQLRKVVQLSSDAENISYEDDVIASPSTSLHSDTPEFLASPPYSPVNKKFSGLKMTNPNSSSSPFRINDEIIFPRTFYMQLGSDTMPSYSSDCIHPPDRKTFNVSSEVRKSLEKKIPEIFPTVEPEESSDKQAESSEKQTENDENQPVSPLSTMVESFEIETSIPLNIRNESFLGDSNGENVEPIGHKSPIKIRKQLSALRSPLLKSPLKSLRSPLKSLPIPSQSEFGVSSPLVVFNLTAQQLISPRKIVESFMKPINVSQAKDKIVNELNRLTKSLVTINDNEDSEQDEPKPSTSKQSYFLDKHSNFEKKIQEVQNEYGFDELLEESRSGIKTISSGNNDNVKMHLQKLKQFLPSLLNKDRDKEIFATSPVKKTKNLFKSPIIDNLTDIRKAFHASTPVNVLKKQKLIRNIFMNTSKIDIPSLPVERETSIDQQNDSVTAESSAEVSGTVKEEEVDENFVSSNLFNDQSELFLNVSHFYA